MTDGRRARPGERLPARHGDRRGLVGGRRGGLVLARLRLVGRLGGRLDRRPALVANGEALGLVVDVFAVHRLVRLAGEDVIFDGPRDWAVGWAYRRRGWLIEPAERDRESYADRWAVPEGGWTEWAKVDPDAPKLASLLTCRWCLSIWFAGLAVAASTLTPRAWRLASRLLALSSAGVLLARLEDDP